MPNMSNEWLNNYINNFTNTSNIASNITTSTIGLNDYSMSTTTTTIPIDTSSLIYSPTSNIYSYSPYKESLTIVELVSKNFQRYLKLKKLHL